MSRLSPDSVILGLLEVKSSHGYHLLEHFRTPARLGNIWKLSTSQLYTILKRLERAEHIDGREEDSIDAPIRTVYWLTDAGRTRFYEWLNDPEPSASTRYIRTEFLSRLYIARLLKQSPDDLIQRQQNTCLHYRNRLIKQRDRLSGGVGYLSLDLRIAELDIILKWLEGCHHHLLQHDMEDQLTDDA